MSEKPQKETKQPAPRPPFQPDLALITYLERDRKPKDVERWTAYARSAAEDEDR
jgi:hypothetical protein